jgi:hypothetical protein
VADREKWLEMACQWMNDHDDHLWMPTDPDVAALADLLAEVAREADGGVRADFEKCADLVLRLSSRHAEDPGVWDGTVSERLEKLLGLEQARLSRLAKAGDALADHPRHTDRCLARRGACSCGLEEALAEWESASEGIERGGE